MKLKKSCCIAALVAMFLPLSALAQEPTEEWVRTHYYNGGGYIAGVIDASGNVYIAGVDNWDYLTIKYDRNGNELWRKSYDAGSMDLARAIAVDSSGNVYVTGLVSNSDWSIDLLTIKYDTNGNELWVKRYGGMNVISIAALAVDSSGNIYITGGNWNAYITLKYDTNGNEMWVQRYDSGSDVLDWATALAIDSASNVYVTGISGGDYATIKYDTNGNELWVKRYDSGGWDSASKIAVDSSDNIYVTGEVADVPNSNPKFYLTIKYDTNGNEIWVRRDGGSYIAVDSSGNVYVTGTDFSTNDYLTIKYDTNGNKLWSREYDSGYGYGDRATAIAVDSAGSVYVTGYNGVYNASTIKYDTNGDELWAKTYPYGFPAALAVDSSGNVYVIGGTGAYYFTIKYSQADTTPPSITINDPVAKDYLISDILIIGFAVTDSQSGVRSFSAGLDGQGVQNGQSINLYTLAPGSHTFTINAEDNAGNKATKSVVFNIIVTKDSLISLIQYFLNSGLIDNQGIATSMIQKIQNGAIDAFLNFLDAQTGKHIDSTAAGVLRTAAGAL